MAQSPDDLEFLRSLDLRSSMVIPLRARDRNIGALTLMSAWSGDRYGADDLRFGQILAGRIGLALDNAGLFSDLESIERRMDTVMSILDEAIVIHGADGELVFANPAAARMMGFESAEEAFLARDRSDCAIVSRSATRMGAPSASTSSPGAERCVGEEPGPQTLRVTDREHRPRALDPHEGAGDQGRGRGGPLLRVGDRGRHRGQARRVLEQAACPDRRTAVALERLPRDPGAGAATAGSRVRRLVLDRDPARGWRGRARGDRAPRPGAVANDPRSAAPVPWPVRCSGGRGGARDRGASAL